MFWFFVLLMIGLALFMILRKPASVDTTLALEDQQALLEVYRQRFDELEKERAADILSEAQYAASRLELEHALLQESAGENDSQVEQGADSDRVLNLCIMILLPVLAFALYYKLGQPDLVNASGGITQQAAQSDSEQDLPSIEELVVGLEKKLQDNPDDERGLWMLTRTYMAMGRFEEALVPVTYLNELTVNEPAVMLLYANVLMLNNNESFVGEPLELIEKALGLEPENTTGLWLAGMAAMEVGKRDEAVLHWQKLLPLIAEDEKASEQVKQLLVEAGASPEQASSQASTDSAASVVVEVSLSNTLQEQLQEGDILFVFARADDGLPMPVAASRLPAAGFPLTVTLDDTTAMMPSRKLSAFDSISVVARVSRSGNAIAEAGDLSSESQQVNVADGATVKLEIDRVLE